MPKTRKPLTCSQCREREATYAMQDIAGIQTFSLLGSHYRGFPVTKLCQECAEAEGVPSPAPAATRKETTMDTTERQHLKDTINDLVTVADAIAALATVYARSNAILGAVSIDGEPSITDWLHELTTSRERLRERHMQMYREEPPTL